MGNMNEYCCAADVGGGWIRRRMFCGVLSFCLLASLSACGGENERSETGPQAGFDIETESFKCRDPIIYWHEQTDRYYLHVNGDGKINSVDLLVLQRHILEIEKIDDIFQRAGNINKNGKKPTSVDLLLIQRHILELQIIKQND